MWDIARNSPSRTQSSAVKRCGQPPHSSRIATARILSDGPEDVADGASHFANVFGPLVAVAPSLFSWAGPGVALAWALPPELRGLAPLADLQLAGLLMWVPLGVVYLAVCLLLASRIVASGEEGLGTAAAASVQFRSR